MAESEERAAKLEETARRLAEAEANLAESEKRAAKWEEKARRLELSKDAVRKQLERVKKAAERPQGVTVKRYAPPPETLIQTEPVEITSTELIASWGAPSQGPAADPTGSEAGEHGGKRPRGAHTMSNCATDKVYLELEGPNKKRAGGCGGVEKSDTVMLAKAQSFFLGGQISLRAVGKLSALELAVET